MIGYTISCTERSYLQCTFLFIYNARFYLCTFLFMNVFIYCTVYLCQRHWFEEYTFLFTVISTWTLRLICFVIILTSFQTLYRLLVK